jgi:hypothetical protein
MGMIMVGIIFMFMVMAKERIMVIIMVMGRSCYYTHQDYYGHHQEQKQDHGDGRYHGHF